MFLFISISVQARNARKPISWKDVSCWKSMRNFSATLSPNDQWMAYAT